jgi:hypothetical protein
MDSTRAVGASGMNGPEIDLRPAEVIYAFWNEILTLTGEEIWPVEYMEVE